MHICGDVLSPLHCPIWKTLDHDNTQRAGEKKSNMHYSGSSGREMEKIFTEGWKRDRLIIVCFGSLHCDISEMLHVLNFSNCCLMPDSFVH